MKHFDAGVWEEVALYSIHPYIHLFNNYSVNIFFEQGCQLVIHQWNSHVYIFMELPGQE